MLAEWHLSPEYILENWTDMQIEAFWEARNRRILETSRAMRQPDREVDENLPHNAPSISRRVSDTELFSMMGIAPGQA